MDAEEGSRKAPSCMDAGMDAARPAEQVRAGAGRGQKPAGCRPRCRMQSRKRRDGGMDACGAAATDLRGTRDDAAWLQRTRNRKRWAGETGIAESFAAPADDAHHCRETPDHCGATAAAADGTLHNAAPMPDGGVVEGGKRKQPRKGVG